MALWPRGSSLDLDKVTPAVARESVERRDSSVPSVVKNGESAGTLAKLSDVDGRNVSPEFENPTFWRGLFMFLVSLKPSLQQRVHVQRDSIMFVVFLP